MSLFEMTSLKDEYKLFDEDPFLLDLEDDACLGEDVSDESDSLTDGLMSPVHTPFRQVQQQQHLLMPQQQQPQQHHQSCPNGRKRPMSNNCKDRPTVTSMIMDQTDDLIPDLYLEVHDYCASSNGNQMTGSQVSPMTRVTIKAEKIEDDDSLDQHQVSFDQTIRSFHLEDQVDCDEQEDDDEDDEEDEDEGRGHSRKSSSSTSSPGSTLGHSRRKSTLDKSLSEEEKRLLHKEGYVLVVHLLSLQTLVKRKAADDD